MQKPPFLSPNDLVGITAPAGKVNPDNIDYAVKLLSSWGLDVLKGNSLHSSFHNFSGTDSQRLDDLQFMLDHPGIKAIFCARGGYGAIRILDQIDFADFLNYPKWIIGFSDITMLHTHITQNFGIQTIHGPMPNTFINTGEDSINYLKNALFGNLSGYNLPSHELNILGETNGTLVGGNLSLLHTLKGTCSDFSSDGKILFIEEVDEYLYSVDRMLWGLRRSHDFSRLAGVMAGSFTKMKDNETPYGMTVYEIIHSHFSEFGIPVLFGFPAGHDQENWPLYMGTEINLTVGQENSDVAFC
jgi:muramoyltetrapeptide carboxypeptidase